MYLFLISIIISHGFSDYFKLNNLSFSSFTINYTLLILLLEFLFIYISEIITLFFIIVSCKHFDNDIKYINSNFFNNKTIDENSLYIASSIITFTSFGNKSENIYIKFLKKLNNNEKSSKKIYNFINIVSFFLFIKLVLTYDIYINLFLYINFLLIQIINIDIYLILYFCLIHIPIDIYNVCLQCNYSSTYNILGILLIITAIIYFILKKIDIYNLNNSLYITGISVAFIHILFNIYKENLLHFN